MTTLPPAPQARRSTNRCQCKTNGLNCTDLCGCSDNGEQYENVLDDDFDDEINNEEEEDDHDDVDYV